jgi:hypothetical protein
LAEFCRINVDAPPQPDVHHFAKGLTLLLGAITANSCSLLAQDNPVDLQATCMVHPRAADEGFLTADGEKLSTTALLQHNVTFPLTF